LSKKFSCQDPHPIVFTSLNNAITPFFLSITNSRNLCSKLLRVVIKTKR
jgi:hypothetical protein